MNLILVFQVTKVNLWFLVNFLVTLVFHDVMFDRGVKYRFCEFQNVPSVYTVLRSEIVLLTMIKLTTIHTEQNPINNRGQLINHIQFVIITSEQELDVHTYRHILEVQRGDFCTDLSIFSSIRVLAVVIQLSLSPF